MPGFSQINWRLESKSIYFVISYICVRRCSYMKWLMKQYYFSGLSCLLNLGLDIYDMPFVFQK